MEVPSDLGAGGSSIFALGVLPLPAGERGGVRGVK